jgi:hypothetical protein
VAEIVRAVAKDGIVVQTELADCLPGESGPHPITRRVAYTYEAADAYISDSERARLAHERKMAARRAYEDAAGQASSRQDGRLPLR